MSGRLLVAVATGAMAFAGCSAGSASDVEQIKKLVGDYSRALADGDGDGACRMLTPKARADIVRANSRFGVTRCEDVAELFHAEGSPEELRELRSIEIGSVRVRGDRATGRPVGLHALERTGDTRLRRIDGRWLIDGSTAS